MRDRLEKALERERLTKDHYDEAILERELAANEYFSSKYNITPGGIIFTDDGQRMKLESFVMWSRDLDKRPDVMAFKERPFGFELKSKMVGNKNWFTELELEGREESIGNV